METKICNGKHGCGLELPIDQFSSYKRKRIRKKGVVISTTISSICKPCDVRKARFLKTGSYEPRVRQPKIVTSKICSGENSCGRELSIDKFKPVIHRYKNKSGELKLYPGYTCNCKECLAKIRKQYYLTGNGKEQSKEYHRRRLDAMTEEELKAEKLRVKQKNRKYRSDNPEKTKERDRRSHLNRTPEQLKSREKKSADELSDRYIKSVLRRVYKIYNPTPQEIEIKRLTIKIKRLIKQEKDEQLSESK